MVNNEEGNSNEPNQKFDQVKIRKPSLLIYSKELPSFRETFYNTIAGHDSFFTKIESIKRLLKRVNVKVAEVEATHSSILSARDADQLMHKNNVLETLTDEINLLNKEIKVAIQGINTMTLPLHTTDRRIRLDQVKAIKLKFMDTIRRYQEIQNLFNRHQREKMERQILLVLPHATAEDIENIIEADEVTYLFGLSQTVSRLANVDDVKVQVHARHSHIKKLEKSISELHQMFMDMETFVEMQNDIIINIAKSSDSVNADLHSASTELTAAIRTSSGLWKKKCCYLTLACIISSLIASLIWSLAFYRATLIYRYTENDAN